ncbi:MAG: Stp1/IreP family PP2C-type Ser/Thr phosphatase [Janthinobacterium lividum]
MNISAGAKTDTGQRPNNEDRYAVVDTRKRQIRADGVLIIADGMGGRSFGEQAATTAVETTEDALAELLDSRQVGEVVVADALATALRRANARVYELASADDDRKGMGTTCVAAVVEGDHLYVAHAGDSRAYLLRDGILRQITHDHSYVAEQVRAGAITEEGARSSRFRNIITRAIGIEPTMEAEVSEADVQPGDMLLLCTDGLSNIVAEEDITRTLMQSASPQAAADKLVLMAVKSGGRDNITAIVARMQAGTRTLRMQVADLVRPVTENGSTVDAHSNGISANNSRSRRSVLWPVVSAVLLVTALVALAGASWLAQTLTHIGYTFRTSPPYAVRPVPPPPPVPPDPAHVAYDAPKAFGFNPVRGSFLVVSPADGTVTVSALSGTVIALTPSGGQVRYKYALPFLKPQLPAPPGALGASGVTLHTATDPQGNLYVSDAVAKTVTKYRPNGAPLGLVAHLSLKNPQAIGAAADGTIYLIDNGRLEVLHAHPSSTPLPPIPPPPPSKPAVTVNPAAIKPAAIPSPATSYGHGYRHYGYGHYGYRR